MSDIILFFYDPAVFKAADPPYDLINIIHKRADDAYTNGILQLIERSFRGLFEPLSSALFPHTLIGLDPIRDMLVKMIIIVREPGYIHGLQPFQYILQHLLKECLVFSVN